MITLITIMGAGQDPSLPGDLLGMRPFVDDLAQQCGGISQLYAHDDPHLGEDFTSIDGKIVLLGHSFGGYEALRALQNLDEVNRAVQVLCLMDPKPKAFFQWINPFYEFPLPTNAKAMQCFWGGFGRPFAGEQSSQKLSIGHADFPSNPIVQSWIREAVMGLVA